MTFHPFFGSLRLACASAAFAGISSLSVLAQNDPTGKDAPPPSPPSPPAAAAPVAPAATEAAAVEPSKAPVASPVSADSHPLRLAGANGREVDFAGIWEARPEGLVVVTAPDAPLTLVAWDRFDIERLKSEQPALDAARQRAIFLRSPQPVNLGLFAGLLTPAQIGTEMRRILEGRQTLAVPLRYRTTTTSTTALIVPPPRPGIYTGLVIAPTAEVPISFTQKTRTVSETRVGPDELTTSPRRVLEALARTDGFGFADRRDVIELIEINPLFLEDTAIGLERIAASLPPRHLLPNDPTLITLAVRLREFSAGVRKLLTSRRLDYADQMLFRDLLYLADSPRLR